VTVEWAFETSDGQQVPFEFTGAPIEDGEGALRGITGVGRNISDQRKQRRRFEAVFNNTCQFTGLMSPGETLLEVNQTAVEFAGRSRDELVGEKVWDAYWFRASDTTRQIARRSVETARAGALFREQITVQGGDREVVIDFSVRPVTGENGAVELLWPPVGWRRRPLTDRLVSTRQPMSSGIPNGRGPSRVDSRPAGLSVAVESPVWRLWGQCCAVASIGCARRLSPRAQTG